MSNENKAVNSDVRVNTQSNNQTEQVQSAPEQQIQEAAVESNDNVPVDNYIIPVNSSKNDIRLAMNRVDEDIEAQEAAKNKPENNSNVRYDDDGRKVVNWADAMMNGVTARGAAKANLENGFFLPEDKEIKKLLTDKGIDEKYQQDLTDRMKREYKDLKDGLYKGQTLKGRTPAQFNDSIFGKTYVDQVQDDLFSIHNMENNGSIKSANIYSYLDDNFKFIKDPETGELVKQRLTGLDRIWNPDLIVDQKKDENGVLTGEFFIREMNDRESRIGKMVLPSWNNPKVRGFEWYEMPAAFISGVAPKTIETIGSLLEMGYSIPAVGTDAFNDANALTKFFGIVKTTLLPMVVLGETALKSTAEDGELDVVASGLDNIIRFGQRLQWKPSDSIAEGGFTGSSSSFMYALSQGLGEFVPQVALGMATGGSSVAATIGSKTAMAMGRQMLTSQALKASTKRTVRKGLDAIAKKASGEALSKAEQAAIKSYDKVAKKFMGEEFFNKNATAAVNKAINTGFGSAANKYALAGTAQAMSGNYNEMIANGLTQQDAAAMSIAMAPIVYATERIIGTKWLESKLGVTQINRAVAKDIKLKFGEVADASTKAAKESIGDVAKNNPTKLKSFKGIKDAAKRYGKKMISKMSKSLDKSVKDVSNSLKGNTAAPAQSNMAKVFGHVITTFDKLEDAYDAIKFTKGYFNPGSMAKGILSEGIQEATEDAAYIGGYFLHDNFLAKEGATKGDGAMGYFSWSRDVISSDTFNHLTESFIGGAAIGGFTAGVMRQRNNRYGNDVLEVESAINGDTEEVAANIAETWRANPSQFGSTEHAPDLQVLDKNGKDKTWVKVDRDYSEYGLEQGRELKSEAEINYYNYLNHLFDTKRMYDETGLGKDALRMFAGKHSILYEGLGAFKIKKNAVARNQEIDKALKDKETPEEEKTKMMQEKKVNEQMIIEADKKYKYLMEDEISTIAEDRLKLNEENKAIQEDPKKQDDLKDPTSSASMKIKENNRKLNELSRRLNKIKKVGSKGHSRGYKDNIKNSVATLMLANEYAVNELIKDQDFKNKYSGDRVDYDEADVKKFMDLRNQWMENYKGEDFYKDARSVYEEMVKFAYQEREMHREIIKKGLRDVDENFEESRNIIQAKFKDIEEELKQIPQMSYEKTPGAKFSDNVANDEYSLYRRHLLSSKLEQTAQDLAQFAYQNRAMEGIQEIMGEFQNKIDAAINTLSVDKKWMRSNQEALNIRKFFKTEADDGSFSYIPREVKEGEDTTDAKSLFSVIIDVNKYGKSSAKNSETINKVFEEYNKSKKFINSNLQTNVNEMYNKGAKSLIEKLDTIKKNDDYEGQPLPELEVNIKKALQFLKELENSIKVRAFAIAPMQVSEESKFLDHLGDVPMDVATAQVLLASIKEQKENLQAHLEIIESKIGLRSNYFVRIQHTEAVMKRNFLTGFLEHSVLDGLGISGLDDLRKSFAQIEIPQFDPDNVEYTDDQLKMLNKANSELNAIYDSLSEHHDKIGKKEVLEPILKTVFYDSNEPEDGEFTSYMENTHYSIFGKNEYWEDIAKLTPADSYGAYSTLSGRTPHYYKHFVNQLVMIGSGLKISELAGQRISMYPNMEIYSSIEQINAENELLAFINGGDEILNMIVDPINGFETKYFPNDTDEREQLLSRYKKGIASLNGDAQTGKSVQVIPHTILIQERINPKDKYILVAHSAETLANFEELSNFLVSQNANLEGRIEVRSHHELTEKGLGSNTDNSLIIIDEATLLNKNKIDALEASYTKNKKNNILFVGDESQMTQFIGSEASNETLIFNSGFLTTPLTKKYATDNPMLEDLMNAARRFSGQGNLDKEYPSAWSEVGTDGRRGIEYYKDISDIAEVFIDRAKNNLDNDSALVFLSRKHYEDFVSNNTRFKKDLEELEDRIFFLGEDTTININDSKSIQGGRRGQIYNMYDGSESEFKKYSDVGEDINGLDRNAIYTIISRSKNFVATTGNPANKASSRPSNFRVQPEAINNDGIIDYLKGVMNGVPAKGLGITSPQSKIDGLSDEANKSVDQIMNIKGQSSIKDKEFIDTDGSVKYDVVLSNGRNIKLKRNTSVVGISTKIINDMLSENLSREQQITLEQLNRREQGGNKGNAVDALWRDIMGSSNDWFINEDGTLKLDELYTKHKELESSTLYRWEEDSKGNKQKVQVAESLWPNQKTFEVFAELLYEYRKTLEQDYYLISDEILLFHEGIEVGGTPDLFLVNKKTGAISIFDLKTKYYKSYQDDTGYNRYENEVRPWYTYTDENGNDVELTDHDKYSYQVNAYRELFEDMVEDLDAPVEMEVNVVLTGDTKSFKGGVPLIGPAVDPTGKNKASMQRHPIKSFQTNIGKAIEDFNKSIVSKEVDHKSMKLSNGSEVDIADEVVLMSDLSSVYTVERLFTINNEKYIELDLNGKRILLEEQEFITRFQVISMSSSIVETRDALTPSLSHLRSAKLFSDSKGDIFYANSESILLTPTELGLLKIDSLEDIQNIKNIKGKLVGLLPLEMIWRRDFIATKDNGNKGEFKSGIFGVSTVDQNEFMNIYNNNISLFTKAEQEIIDKAFKNPAKALELFGNLITFGNPRVFDKSQKGKSKFRPLEITKLDDVAKYIKLIENTEIEDNTLSENDKDAIKEYNIALVKLFGKALLEAEKAKKSGKSSGDRITVLKKIQNNPTKKHVVVDYSARGKSVLKVVADAEKKGYQFNTTLTSKSWKDHKNGNKVSRRIKLSFTYKNKVQDEFFLDVFTPRMKSTTNEAKELRKYYVDELTDFISLAEEMIREDKYSYFDDNKDGAAPRRFYDISFELIKNYTSIFSDKKKLGQRKTPDGKLLSQIIFTDDDKGFASFSEVKRKKLRDGSIKTSYNLSVKEELRNRISFAKFMLEEFKKPKLLKDSYMPIRHDKIGLNSLLTNASKINRPSSYYSPSGLRYDDVVNEINVFTGKVSQPKGGRPSGKQKRRGSTRGMSGGGRRMTIEDQHSGKLIDVTATKEEASNIINKILGKGYDSSWYGFEMDLQHNGVDVWGSMVNGRIKLRSNKKGFINKVAIRHEIFHVVDDYYLSSNTQDRIYKLVKENVPEMNNADNNEIKEWLANWYGVHGEVYGDMDIEKIDEAYLARFGILLEGVNERYLEFHKELAALFQDIERGKFINKIENLPDADMNLNIARMMPVYKPEEMDKIRAEMIKFKAKVDRTKKGKNGKKSKKGKLLTDIDNNKLADMISVRLNDVFDDRRDVDYAANRLSMLIFRATGFGGGKRTLTDTIHSIGNPSNQGSEHIFSNMYIPVKGFDPTKVNPKRLQDLSDAEFNAYIDYHIINDWMVAKGLLQAKFSDYEYSDGRLHGKTASTINDNNSNAELNTSSTIHWLNSTVPFTIEFGVGDANGHSIDYTRFVPRSAVNNIMQQANEIVLNRVNTGEILNFGNYIDAVEDALNSMRTHDQSLRDDNIFSVIRHFFQGIYAGDEIDGELVSEEQINSGFAKQYNKRNSRLGIDMSDMMIAYFTNYRNIVRKYYISQSINYDDNPKTNNMNIDDINVYKNMIKDNITSELFINGRIGGNIKAMYKKKLDKNDENSAVYVSVNSKGLNIGYKEVLEYDPETKTYDFIDGEFTTSNFKDIKNFTGLASLSQKMFYFLEDQTNTFGENSIADVGGIRSAESMTPRQFVATVAANFAEIIQLNVLLETKIDELTKSYSEKYKKKDWDEDKNIVKKYNAEVALLVDEISKQASEGLKQFLNNIGFNKNYIDGNYSITNNTDETTSIDDIKMIKPSDLFTYIEVLGEMMFNQLDLGKTPFAYISSKKYVVHTIMNNLLQTFPTSRERIKGSGEYIKTTNEKASNNLKSLDEDLDNYEAINMTIDGNKATSNNIFISDKRYDEQLDKWVDDGNNLLANITNVSTLPILVGPYFGIEKMNKRDNALSMFSVFIDSISSGKKNSAKLPIGFLSTDQYANIEFEEDILSVSTDSEGNIVSVNYNENALRALFQRNGMMYEKIMHNSFYRLKKFFERKEIAILAKKNPIISKVFSGSFDINDKSLDDLANIEIDISKEMAEDIKLSNLTSIADYKISEKDGNYKFKFGNEITGPVPGSDVYTRANIAIMLQNPPYSVLEDIASNYIRFNNNMISQLLDKDYYGIDKWWKKHIPSGYTHKSRFSAYKGKGDNVKHVYNPLFTAYAMMQLAVSPGMNILVAGTEGQYEDIIDYNKRFNTNNTPVQRILDGIPGGLGETFDIYIYESEVMSGKLKGEDKTIVTNDGGSYGFVPFYLLQQKSIGGTHSKIKKGILKPLSVGTNIINGRNLIVKHALDFHDDNLLANSEELTQVQANIMKLWNDKAREKLSLIENFEDFKDVIDLEKIAKKHLDTNSSHYAAMEAFIEEITNPESAIYGMEDVNKEPILSLTTKHKIIKTLINSIPMGMVPSDSIKSGAKHISPMKPNEDMDSSRWASNTLKTSNYGLINDYNHDINKNSRVTAPNQLLGHIFDADEVVDIMNSMTEIININIQEFYTKIGVSSDPEKWTKKETEIFRNYLRDLGIQSASSNQGNVGLLDILVKAGTMDVIQLARKIEQFQASRFNKLMQPKFHGSRYIQSSAEYLSYFVHKKTGQKYNLTTMKELFTEEEIERDFIKTKFNYMHIENGQHIDSDIATNFMYADVFGINKGEQPEHGFMIKVDGEDKPINFEDLVDKHSDDKVALRKAIQSRINDKKIQGKQILENVSPFARTQRRFMADEDLMVLNDEIVDRLTEYLFNYHDSLKVILARIPFDSPALGFTGRIRQFVWSNGSSVYINPFDNIRTGGDFDIDELSMYYKGFKNAFSKYEDDVKENHLNNVVDSIRNFYSNTNNEDILYNTTGTEHILDEIKKAKAAEKEKTIPEDEWYKTDARKFHSPMGMNNMKAHVTAGDSAIDIYAAGSSAFAYLLQTNKVFLGENNLDNQAIIDRMKIISGLLQGALDNEKVLILGEFNIPASAMNILFGMAANGLDFQQIYKAVNSNAIQQLFKELEKGEDLLEAKKTLPLLIGKYLQNTESWNDDAIKYFKTGIPIDSFDTVNNLSRIKIETLTKEGATDKQKKKSREYFKKLSGKLVKKIGELYKQKRKLTKEKDKEAIQLEIDKVSEAIKQSNNIGYYEENKSSLETLKKAYVKSEALRRLGRIITLRNGVDSNHGKMVMQYRDLQRYLGSDIPSFLTDGTEITDDEKVEYSLDNSNFYRTLNDDEKKIIKEFELDIVKNIDIRNIALNQPYFKTLINSFDNHYQTMKKSFFVNSDTAEDLEYSMMAEQNRVGSQYTNQQSVFGNFLTEVMISEFLNNNYKEPFNISTPISKSFPGKKGEEGYNKYVPVNTEMSSVDISTSKGRRLFDKHFPMLIQGFQDLLSVDVTNDEVNTFFKSIGIDISTEEIEDLIDSKFFDFIKIVGYDGFKYIALDPNVNTTDAGVIEVRHAFKKLPKKLQKMFEIYNLLHNKGQYKQKGLSEVISSELFVQMNTYFTPDRFESLSKKILKPENRSKIHNYLGLNKNIRRPLSKKKQKFDPARYLTVFKKYGLFKSRRPAISSGVNKSGALIHISNNPMFYDTVFNLDDEISTVEGLETIKIPSINDAEFFDMVDGKIPEFRLVYSKPVGYKETDISDIYYITDQGILTSLEKEDKNIVLLSLEESLTIKEITKEIIEKYSTMLSFIPTSQSRVSDMIKNNKDFAIISYNNMEIAEKFSKYGGAFYDDLISRKFYGGNKTVGYHEVEAVPMENEMTSSQIRNYLRKRGIPESEFESYLGIDKMKGKQQREWQVWLKGDGRKTTRYFITINKGEMVSGDNWKLEQAMNLEDSISKNICKK